MRKKPPLTTSPCDRHSAQERPALDFDQMEKNVREGIRHTWYMIMAFMASAGLMSLVFVLK